VRGTEGDDTIDGELMRHQVETRTEPATDLADIRAQLVDARRRVGEVWDDGGETAGQDGEAGKALDGSEVAVPSAARPGSVVPPWRQGLSAEMLSPEYQQVMGLLAERRATGGQPLNCREITALLGLEVAPAKTEGVRCKLKRLVARGWAHEPVPGRFACGDGRDGGS
jgi:hypothetical protein